MHESEPVINFLWARLGSFDFEIRERVALVNRHPAHPSVEVAAIRLLRVVDYHRNAIIILADLYSEEGGDTRPKLLNELEQRVEYVILKFVGDIEVVSVVRLTTTVA